MYKNVFGFPIQFDEQNHQGSLPVYINASYEFRTAYIDDKRCVMLTLTEELVTLHALKKQNKKAEIGSAFLIICELIMLGIFHAHLSAT